MPQRDRDDQDLVDLVWGIVAIVLFVLAIAVAMSTAGYGQNIEGQPIASQYSTWQVSGYAPDTYSFVPTACRVQGGASFFAAFTAGTPVKIVDGNPSLTEIVTPSSVVINNNTCSIAIAPANHHNLPFYLASATGGLQEAINANVAAPAINTIILDSRFYVSVGPSHVAAVIYAALGYSSLGLVDITQTPYVWYQWNGSHYVAVSTGQDVTSVFGRQGVVVAETGDYDCAQVTGCLTSAPVTSVFGRTGAVAAQAGDYACDQVTNCGATPNIEFDSALGSTINSSVTTIPLSASTAGLSVPGYVVIDSEWIEYTGVSGDNLTGATRGAHQTTAASHNSGAYAYAVLADFGSASQAPQNYIISNAGSLPFLQVIGCATADEGSNLAVQIGCPGTNEIKIDSGGRIFQTSGTYENQFISPTGIGAGGGAALIADSGYLFDATRQNQSIVAQGFGVGLAGPVESVQPPTMAAPVIVNLAAPSGSTTWSYECTGTDVDGNTFPGTAASITNGPTTITSGQMEVACPYAAGAASESIWRTAGGPNQGLLASGTISGIPLESPDGGGSLTPGSPPSSNTSIPKVCTGGEQWCSISGTTSTPTVACASGTAGWTFHNVSATVSPFAYVCNGTNWVTAY